MPPPAQVRSMFARIAGSYDFLNHLLSMGIDRRWRRAAVKEVGAIAGGRVLDVCCGTGDLALEFRSAGAQVAGVDFTHEMLLRTDGKRLSDEVIFARGDALCLPVATSTFDVASVAFGIRNVEDRFRGLAEMARVVRPGGQVVVLEFTTPPGLILGGLYRAYFKYMLPLIGRFFSGDDGAYTYLQETVMAWPSPDQFRAEMAGVGLVDCRYRLLTRGIACLHIGTVPILDEPSTGEPS
ncbi:MAG: demethylmenaquinone methyltransferase/2-methoxy-6-polyprenyl-1,4-benzoquinol methylase [Planctomycetota bacterium]|jgi:demethylmenaquinone methyltransferase/2-methoxy-6-polyprenyl-1,4-benzoquinol methylase